VTATIVEVIVAQSAMQKERKPDKMMMLVECRRGFYVITVVGV
jgi:hypothetical protein